MTRPLRLLSLLLLLLPACAVSPQPSPPNLSPEGIRLVSPSAADGRFGVSVEADPGAVDPPRGSVVVTNLDADSAPAAERVEADGSFAVSVSAALEGDVLRFSVRDGGVRSDPLDLLVTDVLTGELVPAPHALEAALLVTPDGQLEAIAPVGAVAEASVLLQNTGGEAIELTLRMREADSPWALIEPPTRLESGASTTLTLRATAAPGIGESVLLIEASGPADDRRAVTLFLTGTD